MKLYNTIAIWDVYCVAESGDRAREALRAFVLENDPNELVAVEASREGSIRQSWRDQKPLVAEDVSDDDFKKLEGKTTIEIFERIYTKRG